VSQRNELKAVFLHQVKVGQSFYCYPADCRSWTRLEPVLRASLPTDNVPVQRDGLQTYMSGMFRVWVRADEDTSRAHGECARALQVLSTPL
jgi:hypothetical protein